MKRFELSEIVDNFKEIEKMTIKELKNELLKLKEITRGSEEKINRYRFIVGENNVQNELGYLRLIKSRKEFIEYYLSHIHTHKTIEKILKNSLKDRMKK